MTSIDGSTFIDIARDLAKQIAARADAADKQGRLPPEDIEALKTSGYLGLTIPQEYGGANLPMRDCMAAQLELAQGSGSTALVAGMQMHIFGHEREMRAWPAEIYERFCREAAGGGLFNSAATEPELGSPSRGAFFAATIEPQGEGYVVNGHKTWTTGGRFLTHLLVSATFEGDPAMILVEGNRDGIEWVETWGDGLSLRASESHDVYFRDVWVPHENFVGINLRGKQNAWFPMMLGATYLGIALAARDSVIQYALERVPTALGKPIATLPKIQRQIGEIDMALQAARALLLEAAAGWDGEHYARIATAKHFAIEVANEMTDKALRIAGGAGVTRDLPLERYFRDVRAGSMQPPSGDTALEIIGRGAIERIGSVGNTAQLL